MQQLPDWTPIVLLTLNALAAAGSAWTALLASRRADRLERVARGAVVERRVQDARTVVAPAWHAPRTSGQRLRAAFDQRRPR